MKYIIAWAATLITAPLWFYIADLERGYDATGGEALILLIPALYMLIDMADKDEEEEEETDGEETVHSVWQ